MPLDVEFREAGLGSTKVVYLVGEFDVTRPGLIEVVVSGPAQTAFWVNEAPFENVGSGKVELLAGRNRITVRAASIETRRSDAGQLRVELKRPADSTLQFELPASE